MWDIQTKDKEFNHSFTQISLCLGSNKIIERPYVLDIDKESILIKFKETERHDSINIRIESRNGAVSILLEEQPFNQNLLTQKHKGE